MATKKILLISDNEKQFIRFYKIIKDRNLLDDFRFYQSINGNIHDLDQIDFQDNYQQIIDEYDLLISLHCRQILPKQLISSLPCINVHPGYNPYNRGWYPHVFAIIEEKITGATIHLMDEKVDHGPIIARKEVKTYSWDTSETLYERILEAEIELLSNNLQIIIDGNYSIQSPEFEGILRKRKDFQDICQIELSKNGTFQEFLNRLRALTHGEYKNAYYIDKKTGKKVFVRIILDVYN